MPRTKPRPQKQLNRGKTREMCWYYCAHSFFSRVSMRSKTTRGNMRDLNWLDEPDHPYAHRNIRFCEGWPMRKVQQVIEAEFPHHSVVAKLYASCIMALACARDASGLYWGPRHLLLDRHRTGPLFGKSHVRALICIWATLSEHHDEAVRLAAQFDSAFDTTRAMYDLETLFNAVMAIGCPRSIDLFLAGPTLHEELERYGGFPKVYMQGGLVPADVRLVGRYWIHNRALRNIFGDRAVALSMLLKLGRHCPAWDADMDDIARDNLRKVQAVCWELADHPEAGSMLMAMKSPTRALPTCQQLAKVVDPHVLEILGAARGLPLGGIVENLMVYESKLVEWYGIQTTTRLVQALASLNALRRVPPAVAALAAPFGCGSCPVTARRYFMKSGPNFRRVLECLVRCLCRIRETGTITLPDGGLPVELDRGIIWFLSPHDFAAPHRSIAGCSPQLVSPRYFY